MAIIKADNRILTKNTKFTFLSGNQLSGVTALPVISNSGFTANDYYLQEDFGNESGEMQKVSSVAGNTTINATAATIFAHPETTRVTKIPFNQVRYYHTTIPTFSAGTTLGTIDIDAQSYYTQYEDTTYGTGFGWFVFYNEHTGLNSAPSNPIPYADFDPNSAKKIIDSFLSSSNNKEMKNISFEDAFRWLSEAYSIAYNELNLVNQEYTSPTIYTITISASTQETALPSDFGKLVSVSDSNGNDISNVKQEDIKYYLENGAISDPRYYVRGDYFGMVPLLSADTNFYIYYNAKSGYLSSYYDSITLPNNNYYCLMDFMMYRAAPVLGLSRMEAADFKNNFLEAINRMKVTSVKQNANKDSWGISDASNI